jgi:hypothetical protein
MTLTALEQLEATNQEDLDQVKELYRLALNAKQQQQQQQLQEPQPKS